MALTLEYDGVREDITLYDTSIDPPSFQTPTRSIFHDGRDWIIEGIGRSHGSGARHPNTVYDDEWMPSGITIRFRGVTSRESPCNLFVHLGVDFFFRMCPLPRPVWYTSPSGCVTHSGSKKIDEYRGTRWCPYCTRDISANNFVSQHMRLCHPMCTEWSLFCSHIS